VTFESSSSESGFLQPLVFVGLGLWWWAVGVPEGLTEDELTDSSE
jgi:hypothetical protein